MIHLFFALLAIAALALTARVIWPLRSASPRLFLALILSMPLLLIALYQITGTPQALLADAAVQAPGGMPHSLDEAVTQLEHALRQHPDQPEGWELLARSYAAQGEFTRARDAWERALALTPDEPIVLTEAAQSRAQAHPQNLLDDAAVALLERAITLQPDHQRARWFIGVAQRQRGEDAAAAHTWEQLLPLVDANTAASLQVQIDDARRSAGLPRPEPSLPAAPVNGHTLSVHVALAPALATRTDLDPDASVFVFARIPGGPPMPVAVERLRLGELPTTLTLDDSSSPMPTQTLSELGEAEVLARLSASGSAVRQETDIDSPAIRVSLPHTRTITLLIGDQP